MALDLGGLARGLGAAGGGYLGGQVAGEKERYRRDQIAANEALKRDALAQQRELVGLRRKELDPKKDIRALAAHDYAQITAMLNDIHNQDDFKHMPGFRQHLVERAQKAQGVVDGSVSPEDYLHLGHEFGDVGAPPPGAEAGAGGAPLGGEALPPNPVGLAPGQTQFDVEGAARQSALPPATTPVGGGMVRQAAGLSPGPLPFQLGAALPAAGPEMAAPPLAAAPAVKAPPTPKPAFDVRAAVRELASSDPLEGVVQGPTETASAFEKRKAGLVKVYNDKLSRLTALMGAEVKTDLGKIKVTQAAPEFKSKQNLRGAQTDQASTAANVNRTLLPAKKKGLEAGAAKNLAEAKAVPVKLGYEGRRTAATEKNANTAAGRLAESKQYHADLIGKAKQAVSEKSLNADDKRDHEIVAARLRVLTAKMRRASGADQLQFSPEQRERAQQEMEDALGRINDRRGKTAAAPTAAAPPAATGTAAVPAAPKGQKPITKGEIEHVRAALALGAGPLKQWLDTLPAPARARFKQVQASIGR